MRRLGVVVPFLVGGALLITGILIWPRSPAGFGWFAYAPLTDQSFVPPGVALSWVPLLLAVPGAVIVAGWTGYLLGRRHP